MLRTLDKIKMMMSMSFILVVCQIKLAHTYEQAICMLVDSITQQVYSGKQVRCVDNVFQLSFCFV